MRLFAGAVLSFAAVTGTVSSAHAQVANNQTDGRDYEALAYLPKDTLVALAYFREQSTSDAPSFSQSLGIFRASYVLKYGNLAIVPFDALLPVVDATVYAPVAGMPGVTSTLHTSGTGDATYLPTIGYIIPEDDGAHTVIGATAYITAPVGDYDPDRPVNIGDHRWRIQPQIDVSQRFLKALTVDLVGSVALYTSNTKFNTFSPAGLVTMKQDPTLGLEAHVFGDLSPTFALGLSYYLAAVGQRTISIPQAPPIDPKQTTQTLRFTFGIHVEKNTGLYLQYDQDIVTTNAAPIERFIGARLTHAMFF
jgi:hypothetical protein